VHTEEEEKNIDHKDHIVIEVPLEEYDPEHLSKE